MLQKAALFGYLEQASEFSFPFAPFHGTRFPVALQTDRWQCSAGKKALPRKELFPAKTGTQTCIPSPIVPVAAIQYLNREWTEPLESSPLSAVVEAAP